MKRLYKGDSLRRYSREGAKVRKETPANVSHLPG